MATEATVSSVVSRYVPSKDVVTPYKTLEKAVEEVDDYEFAKAGRGVYVCAHGDNAYVIIERTDGGVPVIGCSCKAWSFSSGTDGCKHVSAFHDLRGRPSAALDKRIAMELISVGYTGSKGNLQAPDARSTPEPEALKEPQFSGTCRYCGKRFERSNKSNLATVVNDHEAGCKHVSAEETKTTPKEEPKMEKTEDVKRVVEEVEAAGATDVDKEYVAEKLAKLKTFRVTGIEAIRSVVSGILRSQGIKRTKGAARSNVTLAVEQIDAPDVWCNIKVKVTQLWDSDKDSIRQIGLIGDETGVMKFVSWEKANLSLLEADKCYSVENVVTNEYEGRFSVAFTKNTQITPIDEDIVVGFTTIDYSGILVSVQKGSGLIKRCKLCNKAMQHGECKEHGRTEGEHDLRIKAVLDNGTTTKNILLNRERTEALTDISLEAAIEMATEALDAEVVVERMSGAIMMREYEVSGQDMNGTILVENIAETSNPVTKEDIEALLKEV